MTCTVTSHYICYLWHATCCPWACGSRVVGKQKTLRLLAIHPAAGDKWHTDQIEIVSAALAMPRKRQGCRRLAASEQRPATCTRSRDNPATGSRQPVHVLRPTVGKIADAGKLALIQSNFPPPAQRSTPASSPVFHHLGYRKSVKRL